MIFETNFFSGVNLSGVTLFDGIDREDFDREELLSMPGYKTSISLYVEDLGSIGVFGVTGVVVLGVPGVAARGVPGAVALGVPGKFAM